MRRGFIHPLWPARLWLVMIGSAVVPLTAFASDGTWFGQQAIPRANSNLMFDSRRERLIILGGFSNNEGCYDVWALPLTPPAVWKRLDTPTSGIPKQYGKAMYDSTADQIVAVSVTDTSWLVATLPLSGALSWTPFDGQAPRPPRRVSALTALDTRRHRVIIAGGYASDNVRRRDAWVLDLDSSTWEQLSPNVAGANGIASGSALVYDSVGDRLVFVVPNAQTSGGWDVWTLPADGGAKVQLIVSGSGPPSAGAVVFDATRSRVLFLCTQDASHPLRSFSLALDGSYATWSQLPDMASPPSAPSACIDPATERAFLFGGDVASHSIAAEFSSRLRELNLSDDSWATLLPGDVSHFLQGQIFFDGPRDRFLFTGSDAFGYPTPGSRIWAMPYASGGQWSPLSNSNPVPGATIFYDPVSDRMLCIQSGVVMLFEYSLASQDRWRSISTGPFSGTPASRFVYDIPRHRILGIASTGEVQALTPTAGASWTPLPVTGVPPPASTWEYCAYDPLRNAFQFGIRSYNESGNYIWGLWSLSLGDTLQWIEEVPMGYSFYASGGPMVLDPAHARLLSYGAYWSSVSRSPYAYALDLTTLAPLDFLHPSGPVAPDERSGATFAYDHLRDALLVHGGEKYSAKLGGTWSLVFGPGDPPRAISMSEIPHGTPRITFQVHNPYRFAQDVEYELRSTRGWPGFPLAGHLSVSAMTDVPLVLDVPVPDTAAVGANALNLVTVFDQSAIRSIDTLSIANGTTSVQPSIAPKARLSVAGGNPGRELRVRLSLDQPVRGRLQAFDVTGRCIAERYVDTSQRGEHIMTLGGSLVPGVYLVRLTTEHFVVQTRAVIVR